MNAATEFVESTQSGVSEVGVCPFHSVQTTPAEISESSRLVFPFYKRVVTHYETNANGERVLLLFYGNREISFDEPKFFGFGETLAKMPNFMAMECIAWGEHLTWSDVKPLLESLVSEGILVDKIAYDDSMTSMLGKSRPSPLGKSLIDSPKTWAQFEVLSTEITGRQLEQAYLEMVVPAFRVAHMYLDKEGRQIGEGNVFPPTLRLDIETDWRTCPHAGTRYLDDKPMNVTALKSMRAHWKQVMVGLLAIREAYLTRFPQAKRKMTVGDVERLCAFVLAIPTYLLMRQYRPVANGELSPVLSSMFRVTDGLRMLMHQMMFVPGVEKNAKSDDLITSTEAYAYAERNFTFHSTHGVCAGPQAMIEEFMRVVIDGIPARDTEDVTLDAEMQEALRCMDISLDYTLLGLQTHFAAFSTWVEMTRAYEKMLQCLETWHGESSQTKTAFQTKLAKHVAHIKSATYHANEEMRLAKERNYAAIYEDCANGLGNLSLSHRLEDGIDKRHKPEHEFVANQLRRALTDALCQQSENTMWDIEKLVSVLMAYLLKTQGLLRLATSIQAKINTLLGRKQASRAFNILDMDVHLLLQGESARKLPQLITLIEQQLNIRITLSDQKLVVETLGLGILA